MSVGILFGSPIPFFLYILTCFHGESSVALDYQINITNRSPIAHLSTLDPSSI